MAIAALALGAATAEAAFPGDNGVVAYYKSATNSIWTIDPVTGEESELITDASEPAWAPKGQRLVFVRQGALWVAHADGSSQVKLTDKDVEYPDITPTWSPDAKQIAFGEDGGIWLMNADGSNHRQVAWGTSPAWAPNGKRIAYSVNGGIFTVKTDGTGEKQIASPIGANDEWMPRDPDWSPDGRQLVVSYVRNDASGASQLYRFPAGGGTLTPIHQERPLGGDPAWSPDGKQIVTTDADGLVFVDLAHGWNVLGQGSDYATPAWQPLPAVSASDKTPPTVAWSTPHDGQTISGVLSEKAGTCLVTADDASGVAYTENSVDGVFHDRQVAAPWSCEIDTRTLADGPHTLTVRAYDRAGNAAAATIHVIVDNVPDQSGASSHIPSPPPTQTSTSTPQSTTTSNGPARRTLTARQARREVKRALHRRFAGTKHRRVRIRCRANGAHTVETCAVRWSTRRKAYVLRLTVRRTATGYRVKMVSRRVTIRQG